jgi:hypothetical protein
VDRESTKHGPRRDAVMAEEAARRTAREIRRQIRDLLSDAPFPAERNELLRHVGPRRPGPVQAHLR